MNFSKHSPSLPPEKSTPDPMSSYLKTALFLVLAVFFSAFSIQLILENPALSQSFMSNSAWQELVTDCLGGELIAETLSGGAGQVNSARISFWPCLGIAAGILGLTSLFLFFFPL